MDYLQIIGGSVIIFLVITICLAFPPRFTRKVLFWMAAGTALAALGIYGCGYTYNYIHQAEDSRDLFLCVLHTVFDSCRIFGGSSNWAAISAAYHDKPYMESIFWVVHLLALTTSASAIIVSLGAKLLRRIRLWLLRLRNITLIYGLNENTLEFGRQLAKADKSAVLFIDRSEQAHFNAGVDQMDALLRADADALGGTVRFLRSIGLRRGKRKLRVYALDSSMQANQKFARQLLTSLEKKGIRPEQTSLTIRSVSEETDNPLQACPGRYGYGSLLSVSEPELAARMLIRSFPPYKVLSFDKNGKALNDFHGIIIGFGHIGQAVLCQLIMNSQFQGSACQIAVFAPNYEQLMGWLSHECREMLKHYDITFFPYDGRSTQLYDYLEDNVATLNYVAICAGNETANLGIGQRLQQFLHQHHCVAPVMMCSNLGISRLYVSDHMESYKLYTPQLLCSDQIDRMAMEVNQSYQKTGDIRENWKNCSYFDRMSSRAAADFYDALLCAAGKTRDEALKSWEPKGELLENLAATEHMRWIAFHYCMGFRPMTDAEFQTRAAEFRKEKAKDPNTKYRIGKDIANRIHACMIPWDTLDRYSEKENAITGGRTDYAEVDRNNVRDLNKVLQAMENKK